MEILLMLLLLIGLGAVLFGIITYIFMGLSLYDAAELEGIDKKWFAWVPVLNMLILLKIGNEDTRYIWAFVGAMLAGFLTEFNDNGFLLLINLALLLWTVVIQINVYLSIANKYGVNPVWFIVGIFFVPVMLVAYIILHNKVKRRKDIKTSLK